MRLCLAFNTFSLTCATNGAASSIATNGCVSCATCLSSPPGRVPE
jgi:hypothetical protein